MPRRCATVAVVALVLIGLPVRGHGNEIGMQESDPAEPAEGVAADTEAKHLELLVTTEGLEPDTEKLLESIRLWLRCTAFTRGFNEEPGAGPGAAGSRLSESELAALFRPPEVYRSNIDVERLRALAARIAGTDRSGALDGSRATVKGLPSPLAVSGWGSPRAPLVAYVPRAEVPLHLEGDMSGAGALVVDGDLDVFGSFHYTGLLVVLGDLVVRNGAEVSVLGLPLFSGELRVLHSGNFRARGRKTDFALISKTLGGRVAIRQIPLPRIERVEKPTDEEDCGPFGPRM